MENNKISISLNTVIIIAVIIIALIIGVISFVIYDNMKDDNNNNQVVAGEDDNYQSEKPSYIKENVEKETDNNSQISNIPVNTTNSADDGGTINSEPTNSVSGKTSSKQNPLSIGEWGIASKRISGEYLNIPTKVTNVTRGSKAAQEVKDYCENKSSIYKYTDAKEGMEWAVIDYSIDLTKMNNDSTAKLETKVTGTGDNTSIKYNGITYIVSTLNMTPNNYTKGKIETCKFAVQLPIGCSDYLIVLGDSDTQAFFKGK